MTTNRLLKMAALAVLVVSIVSCEKEDDLLIENAGQKEIKENEIVTSDEVKPISSLGYKSTHDMLQNGWTKLDVQITQAPNPRLKSVQSDATISEKLTFAHLNGLGFNEHKLKDLVSKYYGSTPDGISINSEGKFSSKNPTITDVYSKFAYIETGTPSVTVTTQSDEENVVYDYTLYNYSDQTDHHTLSRSHQSGKSSNWSVTSSVNVSIGGKVGVPLISEGSVNVSVGVSASGGGSESYVVTNQLQSSVSVPPHSKRRVVLIERVKRAKYEYEIPVLTSGYIGSNFGHKVNGHYYWFTGINNLLGSDGRQNELGKISYQNVLGGEMYAYTPEPLN